MPTLSREALEVASGITIPDATFVLRVIVAYMIALVPLNWLVCRYVFGRREWAWVVAPILSLAFAVGVERAAAFDLGYDSACDEIDVIETYGDYPRAHVSRFASLYSTGRVRYTISYPDDPTALALPLSNGRSIGGEDVAVSSWQSYPVPALEGFLVQPRSLAMFRAEQMATLTGTIRLETDGEGSRRIVNGTDLELRDAVLVDLNGAEARRETPLGTIAPGATVPIEGAGGPDPASEGSGWLDPGPLLEAGRVSGGESPRRPGGDPARGLDPAPAARAEAGAPRGPPSGPDPGRRAPAARAPPSPDGPHYNLLAKGPERAPAEEEAREDEMRRRPDSDGGAIRNRPSRPRGPMLEPFHHRGRDRPAAGARSRRRTSLTPCGGDVRIRRRRSVHDRGPEFHQAIRRVRGGRGPEPLDRQERGLRLHRPQRRRQEHDDPLPGHLAPADLGGGVHRRAFGRRRPHGRAPGHRLHARRLRRLRRDEGLGVPRLLRGRLRDPDRTCAGRSSARSSSCWT